MDENTRVIVVCDEEEQGANAILEVVEVPEEVVEQAKVWIQRHYGKDVPVTLLDFGPGQIDLELPRRVRDNRFIWEVSVDYREGRLDVFDTFPVIKANKEWMELRWRTVQMGSMLVLSICQHVEACNQEEAKTRLRQDIEEARLLERFEAGEFEEDAIYEWGGKINDHNG